MKNSSKRTNDKDAKLSQNIRLLSQLNEFNDIESYGNNDSDKMEVIDEDVKYNSEESSDELMDEPESTTGDDHITAARLNDLMKERSINKQGEGSSQTFTIPDKHKKQMDALKIYMTHFKKSWKLKKMVKILPRVPTWEVYLNESGYFQWTPEGVFRTTKIFYSNGGEVNQKYYSDYLLVYIRNYIKENGKLNSVLYNTLIDAVYRRFDFIMFLAIPWIQDDIDGREAEILASVFKKASIKPIDNTCLLEVVMLEILSDMEYNKPCLSILKVIIEKKNVISDPVIPAFVDYFYKVVEHYDWFKEKGHFVNNDEYMPLKWFEILYTFMSKLCSYLTKDQLEKLKKVCKVQVNPKYNLQIKEYISQRETSLNKMSHGASNSVE